MFEIQMNTRPLLVTLFLGIAQIALAADSPEIAQLDQKYKVAVDATEQRLKDTTARAAMKYQLELNTAERAATISGNLDSITAINSELNDLRENRLEGQPRLNLPKQLHVTRAGFIAEKVKLEAEAKTQSQKSSAEYLRGLAALQTRAAGNPALLAEIETRKNQILNGEKQKTVLSEKFLENTEWYWQGEKDRAWTFLPGGKCDTDPGSKPTFVWKVATADTFTLSIKGVVWETFKVDFVKMVATGDKKHHFEFKRRK
jgi:hypothetical protein